MKKFLLSLFLLLASPFIAEATSLVICTAGVCTEVGGFGGGGGSSLTLQDEGGTVVGSTLNFTGAGVSCTAAAGVVTCDIPGGAATAYATIQEEGTPLTQRATLNFIGSRITCVDNTTRTNCTVVAENPLTFGAGLTRTTDTITVGAGQITAAMLVSSITLVGTTTGTFVGNLTGVASGNQLLDSDLTLLASQSAINLLSGKSHQGIDSGSTDAYVACPESLLAAGGLTDGAWVNLRVNTNNIGNATFDGCTFGVRNIVKNQPTVGATLANDDLRAGVTYRLTYKSSSTVWEVDSLLGNAPAVGDITSASTLGPDNGCIRADGTTTKVIQGTASGCTISDTGAIVGLSGTFGNIGTIAVSWSPGVLALVGNSVVASFNYAASQDIAARTASPTTGHCARFDSLKIIVDGGSCRRSIQVTLFGPTEVTAVGDGRRYYRIPSILDGFTLVAVNANVVTAGTTGTLNFDIDRCVAAATSNICTSTVVDVLSTNGTIDSGENSTTTAATPLVISGSNNTVNTGQIYRFNVDAVHTTPALGLFLSLEFEKP